MKTTELRTGLYFTLSEENLKELIDIKEYYNSKSPNAKRNKYFTAIKHENEWYMINTSTFYEIQNRFKINTRDFLKRVEDFQGNSFYNSSPSLDSFRIKLDDEKLELFEMAFDIRDKEFIKEKEIKKYKDREFEYDFLDEGRRIYFKDKTK